MVFVGRWWWWWAWRRARRNLGLGPTRIHSPSRECLPDPRRAKLIAVAHVIPKRSIPEPKPNPDPTRAPPTQRPRPDHPRLRRSLNSEEIAYFAHHVGKLPEHYSDLVDSPEGILITE